ncbi:unnamed protein product, partial [Linum tenue]
NILVKTFRYARDRLNDSTVQQVEIKLLAKRERDGREYDLPSANEVAALIVDDTGEQTFSPDIVVQYQSNELEQISIYHPSLMALQYPILFPHGEDGWHPNISRNGYGDDDADEYNEKNVTQCDFYSYRLQTRLEESNALLLCGKLFQQYVVNAYALVEAERLDWIKNNQTKLRQHYYQGLLDSYLRGDSDTSMSGKQVILASSHTGSPRYKYESFQDAMAICRWAGYPDLFITFTCNPAWPEIQHMVDLIRTTTRKDPNRADVFARVFKLKLHQMLKEILENKIFGKTSAYVMAIEFQKRGLPHAHLLVFLAPEDKLYSPSEIDSIISAEIPDHKTDPECYEAVSNFMFHGPCGIQGPKAPCTTNGVCSKHFPKEFCSQTTIDGNGFARYRRRENNRSCMINGVSLDNRFVVPYNRYLLLRFQAHINVEFCNKSRAIKYLFKYINKPEDRAMATLESTAGDNGEHHNQEKSSATCVCIDEIKAFLDCRYITSGEACWRLFKFDISSNSPSVLRMSCHLPGENKVVTKEKENIEIALEKDETSMLLAWMKINAHSSEARKYTFVEFPQHFVWNRKSKKWQMRKNKVCIGRLYYCPPSANERFYLRMLLHLVRGCRSYEDIRTVDGVIHDSFQKACYALRLLADDDE